MKPKAKFVWSDGEGEGTNLYTAFRKNFICNAPAIKAVVNVFADSAYHLYVNGKFVNFGPARFNPKFPEYDEYDITDLVVSGKNNISVLVNYFGVKTYKSIENGAGFIAWGEISLKNGEKITINTGNTEWKTRKIQAYDENAPKLSFALNQMEIFDQKKDEIYWNKIDFDDSDWNPAVILENQSRWGELSPRSIPFMSNLEIIPEKLLGIFPLKKVEKTYSFKVPALYFFNKKHEDKQKEYILFKTWLHSPKKQNINVGLFWGEHWLNGKELTNRIESDNSSLKYNHRVSLEAGWNYFFGYVRVYADEFAFYLNLPIDSGVEPFAEKDLSCPYSFSYTDVLNQSDFNQISKHGIPLNPDSDTGLNWKLWDRNKTANNPGRENDLDIYGEQFEKIELHELVGRVFKKSDYPDGFAVIIDMGKTSLFRIGISLEGAEGATVDFSLSERLRQRKLLLYLNHTYHASARAIFSENSIHHETFHPYGGRYIAITFRNLKQDIQIKSLKFISANYPVEAKGSFKCSENALNKIWQICADTQRADMEDAYIDCPTRERGMYARDGIIQYYNNLALFGDHALMKRFLRLFAQNPSTDGRMKAVSPTSADYVIADFSLNLMEGFYAYYLNTGDIEFIKESWEAILKNMEWFNNLSDNEKTGLLTIDWPGKKAKGYYGGFHGDLSATKDNMKKNGISCVFTCTYICALRSVKLLAEAIGDTKSFLEYSKRLKSVSKNAQKYFWDKRKKCFSDDLEHTTHSVQANCLAVLSNLPSKKQVLGIREHLDKTLKGFFINGYDAKDGVLFSPSYGFYILDALYKIGLVERAEELIVKGWGLMLSNGLTTCREHFERHHDSFCHAWSAHPAYFLSKNILGVSYPDAPNFNKVKIEVKTHSVNWAEGTYPHPKGIIRVKWSTNKNGKKVFKVKAPRGVSIFIE